MSWWEALLLGIIQGLTEFLPVSSSGHLEIGQALLGILNNPVSIVAIITAFLGIYNDNSTKGLDKPTVKKSSDK